MCNRNLTIKLCGVLSNYTENEPMIGIYQVGKKFQSKMSNRQMAEKLLAC